MHGFDLIATIAGGFTAALILGYITQRIGLSPLVGYLLAGVLVANLWEAWQRVHRRSAHDFPRKAAIFLREIIPLRVGR